LALFGHKISLYRFNQGAHTIAGVGAQIGAGELSPLAPSLYPLDPLESSQGVWGSAVSSPDGVWVGAPAEIEFAALS